MIDKKNIFVFCSIFLILLIIFFALPKEYLTKTIVKPITRINFDNKVFELSTQNKELGIEKEHLKKIFEDEKKVLLKIENVDSLTNNSPSPLVLFYEFYRIIEDQNYKESKFQVDFFENSFEFFFIISIKGKKIKNNEEELIKFLRLSNKSLNNNFNAYLLNSKVDKQFNLDEFSFIDVKLDNLKSKSTKISIEKFILFNLIISFFLTILFYSIRDKKNLSIKSK